MRKIIQLHDEFKKIQDKANELEKLKSEAEAEEKQLIDKTLSDINKIADEAGFFAGIVLSKQDIVSIIDLALKTGEAVKIPVNIYFKEV